MTKTITKLQFHCFWDIEEELHLILPIIFNNLL